MADARRLAELGMVPPLAKEVAAQITAGTGDVRRLAELTMVPRLAREVSSQITTKVTSVVRLAELGMVPALALEVAIQIKTSPFVFVPSGLGFDSVNYPITPTLSDPGGMADATGDAGITPQALFDMFSTARSAPGTTYYQGPDGSDAANGLTYATRKATISSCITAGNATGSPYRIFTTDIGGSNYRPNGPAGTDPTQDVAIIGYNGGRATHGTFDNFVLPTLDGTYTTLYKATLANVNRLCNRLSQNQDGNNVDYEYYSPTVYGSVAAALTAANSATGKDVWVYDSGSNTYYCKRADGVAPTPANTRLYRGAVFNFRFRLNVNVYLENIDIEGSAPIDVIRTTQQTVTKVFVANNCSAKYAGGLVDLAARGFSIYNMKGLAYLYNCTAMANATDGFNFGDDLISGQQFLIVNPIANDNGRRFDFSGSSNQSCNGVTAHQATIGIVLGGQALRNHGGSARYINSTKTLISGLRSNDLGDVVFGGSIPPTAFQNDNTSEMWLDRTKADVTNGQIAYNVGSGAIQHMRNTASTPGSFIGAGTRNTY